MEHEGIILVTELQDEILGLAGYCDAVRWKTVSKHWNKVIIHHLNTAKIKMLPKDRLQVALAKLKLRDITPTTDQIKILQEIYDLDGVRTFLSHATENFADMFAIGRSVMFIWFYAHDEYVLFKQIVSDLKQMRHNRFDWFIMYCAELHFILPYLTLCAAPELDLLGVEIAKVVDQFLTDINANNIDGTPTYQQAMQHEEKYIELLERMFAMIKATADNKISPDMLTALQVLKSDLQPIANNSDRRPENFFVPICYFLNKAFVNVPNGAAKQFLRGNLSLLASQIVRKQILDDIDHRIIERFHSRVIDIFDGCLKGTPPVTYRIKDPIMPVTPAIFINCIEELIKARNLAIRNIQADVEALLNNDLYNLPPQ